MSTAPTPRTDPAEVNVLTEHSPELPLVNVSVSLCVGSELDPEGKEGLSEILVRLMRRNAGGREADDNDRRVDALGASLGADVAASTMGFHGTVISRSFGGFSELLGETLASPGFVQAELDRLKREMHGELIESLDNDRALARRWFRRRLFEDHPYGRPVSGTPKSLESIQLEDVQALYQRVVAPANLVFAFAGDVAPDAARATATQIVQNLSPAPKVGGTSLDPQYSSGRRLVIVDKPERTQTQILMGCLGTNPHDADHTALHVANTIFGGTFTARLTQEVRAKRGWSYGAYSSLPFDRCRHAFSMWTFPKASDAPACIRLELELLEHWYSQGVTEQELEWAKSYLVRSHAFALDTAAKRVGLRLDAELYQLPEGYYEDYESRVQAVTLDEANAAVRSRISTKDLLIAVVGTAKDIEAPVAAAIQNLAHREVVPFDALD